MKKELLFVSQDQGSGNALFPVIKELLQDKNLSVRVFAARQSKNVFLDQGISFKDLENKGFSNELDFNPDLIVTGASMRKCIEKEAILFARTNRIKTITILDFWGYYWERFTVNGERNSDSLPDYICTMDEIARLQMISDGFSESKLVVTGNPYFDTFQCSGSKKINSNCISVLYVSQPVFRDGSYQSDRKILEDILNAFVISGKCELVIRPHPKDAPGAFAEYENENLKVESRQSIGELIVNSDIVIGKSSSVLFEAVFRGKLVISYQPTRDAPDWLVTNQLGLSYLVRSKQELEKIQKKVVNKQLKSKNFGVLKYYNDGNCTKRVIKYIKKILD